MGPLLGPPPGTFSGTRDLQRPSPPSALRPWELHSRAQDWGGGGQGTVVSDLGVGATVRGLHTRVKHTQTPPWEPEALCSELSPLWEIVPCSHGLKRLVIY